MATDFELTVLKQLSSIESICATNTQAHKDLDRRVGEVELTFKTQDTRNWVKGLVLSVGVLVAHPLIRKMGWDV